MRKRIVRILGVNCGAAAALTIVIVVGLQAQSQPTREEVLRDVFPNALIRSERLFLTDEQKQAASSIAGTSLRSRLIARYVVTQDDQIVGRAYIDTHTVRTKKQSLIICLNNSGAVLRVETTAFLEPPEYLASDAFFKQYSGKKISKDLYLNRQIRPIAGATLTVQSINQAVRRITALDQIFERQGK